jgi:LysM repeat protein
MASSSAREKAAARTSAPGATVAETAHWAGAVPRVVNSRLRITRRGRAVLTTLLALPVVATALVLALNSGMAFASEGEPAGANTQSSAQAVDTFGYVTVKSGQSMWTLAETIAPKADPRDVIAEIVALNQLTSASLSPGQQLAVPVAYAVKHN